MSKNLQRIIVSIPFAIMVGLMVKHFGYDTTILVVLLMIFIELFIGSDKE